MRGQNQRYSIFRHVKLVAAAAFALVATSMFANSMAQQSNQNDETVVAASNMKHPPFSSWGSQNTAAGIEVEIVESAAAQMGQTVEWQEVDFADLLKGIATKQFHVAVATIGITEDRKQLVAFSEPYYETNIVALVKPDSEFKTLDDLIGKKIGADATTTSFVAAKKRWPKATFVQLLEGKSWPQMIQIGSIDAFVVDASDQLRLESTDNIRLRKIAEPLARERFAIAFRKDWSEDKRWVTAINESVRRIRPNVPLRLGNEYQFSTLGSKAFHSLPTPPLHLIQNYLAAKTELDSNPQNVEAIIWFGRRAGHFLRLNEAIEIFTKGIKQFPNDARLYRHRGHRYISSRKFSEAIADFKKASELIEGTEDQIEPDGAPNPQGIPLTTLQGNVWYHLGLAYYLKNDLKNAELAFRQREKVHRNDDNIVSFTHWLYMILRRQGNHDAAQVLVREIKKDMTIIENMDYHRMCLFYNGTLSEQELLSPVSGKVGEVPLYGVANWYLYEKNNKQKAKVLMERLFETGNPAAFAYIAAEADYVRLFGQTDKRDK